MTLPVPTVSSVEPVWGYNGEETQLNVYGDNFYPHIEVNSGVDEVFVDRTFALRLYGPIESGPTTVVLPGVTLTGYHHLHGTVPEGLTPGTYDVIVEGPLGDEGQIDSAFVVTDTRVDHVRPMSDDLVYEVYETAWVEFFLEDPEDARMFESLDVTISVTSNGDVVPVEFDTLQLESAEVLEDQGVVLGSLDDEGYARLGITLAEPQIVEISVSATDPKSVVDERTMQLLWEPGSAVSLDIILPDNSGEYEVVAGEEFPVRLEVRDTWGNLVDTTSHAVALVDACQTMLKEAVVTGTETVNMSFSGATGNQDCKVQQIESIFGPPGLSETIDVVPGPTTAFDIRIPAPSVVAGEWLNVFIDPVDTYGNVTLWSVDEIESLVLQDSMKGVVGTQCYGDVSSIFCRVRPTVTSDAVTLTVSDESGTVFGISKAYSVLPDAVTSIQVSTDASVIAGQEFPVNVHVLDVFGNPGVASTVAGDLVFTDSLDEVSCATAKVVDDLVQVNCTLVTATPKNLIETAVSSALTEVLPAYSGAIEVVNGPIATVQITPMATTVIAGDLLQFTFLGLDLYGNTYVQQTDAVIDIVDTFGTASPNSVTLGASGQVVSELTLTQAGFVTVTASQDGVVLGESPVVEVVAAEAVSLGVEIIAPWVIVGEPVDVVLTAYDSWGNHDTQFEEGVVAFPTSGAGPAVNAEFVAGVATLQALWTTSPVEDQLSALSDDGVTGDSAMTVVGADCGDDSPQYAVDYGALTYGVGCFDGESAFTTVSHTVSASGSAPVALYAVSVDGGTALVDGSSNLVAEAHTTGRRAVESLVVNEDGCGTLTSSDFYVAYDDGSAAGVVPITSDATSYVVGVDQVELSIGPALDCAGDVAAGSDVYVRSTRGALLGGATSGKGIVYQLDGDGNASLLLDHVGESMGGLAELTLWTDSGAGVGQLAWDVVGDDMRPTVWSVTPVGMTDEEVSNIIIRFSEPIYYANIGHYGLSGPSGVSIDTVTLVYSGYGVLMTLSDVLDTSIGEHFGYANNLIRDSAGNRLDGEGSGAPSDFLWSFGDTPFEAPNVTSCVTDEGIIRPNGDDGVGVEQDTVTTDMVAASTPVRWHVSVDTDNGERILHHKLNATNSAESWVWDARDVTGAIVQNGTYEILVEAADEYGNLGDGCSAIVSIDNVRGE